MSLRVGPWVQPASLWSTAYVDTEEQTLVHTSFDREQLRNGSRWPIVVTRVALSPVNYGFARYPVRGAGGENAFYQATLRVSFPFRKSFSRMAIPFGNYTPRPTGMPVNGNSVSDSSLWGVSYLRFDEPLILPRKSGVELGLTSLKSMALSGDVPIAFSTDPVTGYIYWHEKGGLFSGSARVKAITLSCDTTAQDPTPDPYAGVPFPLPPAYEVPVPLGPQFVPMWGPAAQMNARDYEQQEATRSGSTEVYGVGVFLDQRAYDDAAILAAAGADASFQIAQLSTRTGVRVRASHSPSGNWWWRPGAPLALVLDTITPAVVYDLPEPITVAPGDTLTAALELPGSAASSSGPNGWQVGISFNGYTKIEG